MKKSIAIFSSLFLLFFSAWIALADSFKIEEVEVVERDTIEVLFSRQIDNSLTAIREFILENTTSWSEIQVLFSEVVIDDPNKVILILDEFLQEQTNYTITILDIKDVDGNTIEAGIDSVFTFNSWVLSIWNSDSTDDSDINQNGTFNQNEFEDEDEDVQQHDEIFEHEDVINDEDSTIAMENDDSDDVFQDDDWLQNLNSAPNEPQESHTGIGGSTISQDEMGASTLTHAENSEALPDTGPEIIFLLLLTMLLSAGILYFKQNRAY